MLGRFKLSPGSESVPQTSKNRMVTWIDAESGERIAFDPPVTIYQALAAARKKEKG